MEEMYALDSRGRQVVPGITDTDVYVKFEITEPLLLSLYIRIRSRKTRLLWDPGYELSDGHERGKRKPSVAKWH